MEGFMPDCDVDHINKNKKDNRWCNLRKATRQQNMANISAQANNSTGFKGVKKSATKGKYIAQICVSRNVRYLGTFDTPEEAHQCYISEARKSFKQFASA